MRNIVWVIALVGLGLALITGGELAQGSDRVQYALWIVGIGLILLAAMLVGRRSPTPDLRPAPGSRVAAELDHAGLLYAALDRGQPTFESLARPRDLLQAEAFEDIVDILRWPDWQGEELIQYLGGANPLLACAAAEALLHREESAGLGDQVVEKFGAVAPWVDWFILRYLGERCTTPVVGRLLVAAHNLWPEYAPSRDYFNAFLQERRAVEGDPGFGYRLESCSEQQLQAIEAFLLSLRRDLAQPLLDEIAHWRHQRVDLEYLRSVGRLWPQVDEAPELVMHAALPAALETLEQALNQTPPRSVVVVGESGVGKSELIREWGRRLQESGWRVFEASAADVMAGQIHLGEVEQRVKSLVDNLGAERHVLWYVPNFHELYFAARHRYSDIGVLDLILPHVDQGRLTVIGETTVDAFERLAQARPRVRTAFHRLALQALNDEAALRVALQWSEAQTTPDYRLLFSPDLVRESHQLARQYLGEGGAPGTTLRLLRDTLEAHRAKARVEPVRLDDVLATLSTRTGLPISVLDDRQGLDLEVIRARFAARVVGQAEAVECLVERIAMLRAGLTDPQRPLGVFLFAGPTGTGKTEIAKALAEFLFGSADRMIRLDLSEYAAPGSAARLIHDDAGQSTSHSLVTRVRHQPFAVILLDEIEKADPAVWDLFLQVFDDGRLTDVRGNTADFRHAIIILTSNLGATLGEGASIGFTRDKSSFSTANVQLGVERTFRREFVNRLDRLVVFRPLARSAMREILHKELAAALGRRGLRKREWAVEWEESAIAFLLERGFTADLGARPLKRAVDQHVLAPLAKTIVQHQFPAGDQFLFLRSDGQGIQVEFVDPDAEETTPPDAAGGDRKARLSLPAMVLDALGSAAEVDFLAETYRAMAEDFAAEDWQARKQAFLRQTDDQGFWESAQRTRVLTAIEFMDRLESGFESAGSLLERITGATAGRRSRYPRQLLQRLAQQLYLVARAREDFDHDRPQDAIVLVEAGAGSRVPDPIRDRAFGRVAGMYRRWAANRRMREQLLSETPAPRQQLLLAVAGFGAHGILAPESGLHVWEHPDAGQEMSRCQIRVRVLPQPLTEPGDGRTPLQLARAALAATEDGQIQVVRRYREQPSPLVRDNLRGWRSGRLDRVLNGDFDLLAEAAATPIARPRRGDLHQAD